jgi:uncharacterized membrane protein
MAQLTQAPLSAAAMSASPRPSIGELIFWWLSTLLCALAVVGSSRYFFRRPSDHFGEHFPLLLAHIIGGTGALLIGPWQFSRRLRQRHLELHRWLGRIYLCSVALGSLAGFTLPIFSEGALPVHSAFACLAVAWFFTGLMAYRRVIAGNIQAHREWMIRNFSLSLAAVTLRIYLPLLLGPAHWTFLQAYVLVSGLCWVPNLLVAEWLIRRRSPVPAI